MKWENFLRLVSKEPVFKSSVLKAGDVSTARLQQQLVRWVNAGRVIQLRRGLYALAEPYRNVEPHPFLVANRLKKASYVSLQSALHHHGLIPEYVPVVTGVSTGRPGLVRTELGAFLFKHVKKTLFNGFREIEVAADQYAFVATPEKALLDLIYLTPQADGIEYLRELRLQNPDALDASALLESAVKSGSPKLLRAARRILRLLKGQKLEDL
jgi:predicted transcriptional regulator of viral defense system